MLGSSFQQNKFYIEVLVWLLHSDYLQVVIHNVTLYSDEEGCVTRSNLYLMQQKPTVVPQNL